MTKPLVEQMAERFVHKVHDLTLSNHTADFFGTWAVVQNNRTYEQLISKLSEAERDLLWSMIDSAITRTMDATLQFIDRQHVNEEMRIVLRDPESGEEVRLFEDEPIELRNEFWLEWFERYVQVRDRPKTTQHLVHKDDIPPPVRQAVVRDFEEAGLDRLFREIDTQRRTLAYHVMWGMDRQATYDEDGRQR